MGSLDQHCSSSSFTWTVHIIWTQGKNYTGRHPGHGWPWWLSLCLVYSIDSPGSYSHMSLGFESFPVIAWRDCTGSHTASTKQYEWNIKSERTRLLTYPRFPEIWERVLCSWPCYELHASVASFEETRGPDHFGGLHNHRLTQHCRRAINLIV